MPDPFRLRALKNLTTLIESAEIDLPDETGTPVTSLTARVFRGREAFGDSDPLPMVSILEPPLSVEPGEAQPDNRYRTVTWDLLIQGWVADDKENPCDPAYRLAAWVMQTLSKERSKRVQGRQGPANYLGLGDAIQEIRIGSPVVRPADFPSATACFYLLVTLKIVEDMGDPFS